MWKPEQRVLTPIFSDGLLGFQMIDRAATVTDSLLCGKNVPVVRIRTAPNPNHIALPLANVHTAIAMAAAVSSNNRRMPTVLPNRRARRPAHVADGHTTLPGRCYGRLLH